MQHDMACHDEHASSEDGFVDREGWHMVSLYRVQWRRVPQYGRLVSALGLASGSCR